MTALNARPFLLWPSQVSGCSKPALDFPAGFLQNAPMFMHGGLTVNGVTAPPWPFAPKPGAERY